MLISKWKDFSAEGIALGERLNVQNRPKRCLFLSVAKPILAKVHTVQIVEFISLPAPRIFTKLLKIPIYLLKKLNVSLIFLEDILIMASSIQETTLARDTLIFLLQGLGFLINIK